MLFTRVFGSRLRRRWKALKRMIGLGEGRDRASLQLKQIAADGAVCSRSLRREGVLGRI